MKSDRAIRFRHVRGAVLVCACLMLVGPVPPAHGQSLGCTPESSWAAPDGAAAGELLAAVNLHRSLLGLPQLSLSGSLMRAAEWKAAYMAATGQFSHNDPGRTWEQRIATCGYEHPATENIGLGYPTATVMLNEWLLSSGHRVNIEDPQAVATGVAAVRNSAGAVYWVQVFGTALDADDAGSLPPASGADPADPGDEPDDPPADDPTGPPDDGMENTAPVAVDDTKRVRPRRRVMIVVLANDSDADGDPLELLAIVESPTRGRATFDPTDGTIRYRARRGTAGRNDRLTYRIGDGNGGFDVGEVRFRIRR